MYDQSYYAWPKENSSKSSLYSITISKMLDKGILLRRNGGLVLEAYTDAEYIGSIVDTKSTIKVLYLPRWDSCDMDK